MLGLDDRLWVGYWIGGATASAMGFIAAMGDLPFWIAFMMWVALTPLGIYLARDTLKPNGT